MNATIQKVAELFNKGICGISTSIELGIAIANVLDEAGLLVNEDGSNLNATTYVFEEKQVEKKTKNKKTKKDKESDITIIDFNPGASQS